MARTEKDYTAMVMIKKIFFVYAFFFTRVRVICFYIFGQDRVKYIGAKYI